VTRIVTSTVAILSSALALAGPALAVESPPSGVTPSEFATQYKPCLGKLRSLIARGVFDGVGPFGLHFTGDVNPGAHQGTVGEEEFIRDVLELTDVKAFCDWVATQ
jgi:hypothetical protein